jgi:SAM-dependent methyltransferase
MSHDPSTATLHAAWRRCADYLETVAANGWMAGRADVSEFWREYLDARPSYPSFNDALVLRRGATWPLAERGADAADPDAERPWAESAWFVTTLETPQGFVAQLEESPVGAPVTFEFEGRPYSAGFLTNALTTWRIAHWVAQRGLSKPLRVLEIGAGYGQVAHQLHQLLPIELYAVCDLPENLFLGAYYLQANLPDRAVAFVGADGTAPTEGLAFTIPPFLERLGGGFDVIVNTYSFQEMNRESVEEYFRFAETALAPEGFLYSLNTHGKAGVTRPSEYPVAPYDLLGFTPVRRFPFQATATAPYELVLGRADGSRASADAETIRLGLDALGRALQLGLQLELAELCQRLAEGSLSEPDLEWLRAVDSLFESADPEAKEHAAQRAVATGVAPEASAFLAGALAFAGQRTDEAEMALTAPAAAMPDSYARALALVMLGWCARRRGDTEATSRHLTEAVRIVPSLQPELARLLVHPRRLAAHLGTLLGLPDSELPRRLPRPFANMATAVRGRTPVPRRRSRSGE